LKEFPTKLGKALELLDEEQRQQQSKRYHHYHELALKHAFQSPEFWASRMILSGRNDVQIDRVIAKRLKKQS
jgi:hypothetical protein